MTSTIIKFPLASRYTPNQFPHDEFDAVQPGDCNTVVLNRTINDMQGLRERLSVRADIANDPGLRVAIESVKAAITSDLTYFRELRRQILGGVG